VATAGSDGKQGRVSFFAATVPGLGVLLAGELAGHPGLEPDREIGGDGRADLVSFRISRGAAFRLNDLRLAEDVFAEISAARRAAPVRLAAALVPPAALERALSVRASRVRPLSSAMTFRAVVRVLDESQFKRTELRTALERAIGAARPRWRIADPADLEVWAVESRRGWFVSGLRLSDERMRQHGEGRARQRHGALRPVVAAAMVRLASAEAARTGTLASAEAARTGTLAGAEAGRTGPLADAGPGPLLDPCCGSGTIVAEAMAAGWAASGCDIDPEAVSAARANVPAADIQKGDALRLPYPAAAFGAVVANLPFGRQFRLHVGWDGIGPALREAARVTRPGGRVVVLVPPPIPQQIAGLTLTGSYPIRLLGVPARIWAFDRDG
jgi:Methyltransferase domain